MKYSIVATSLFAGAFAAWAPPAGYSDGGWGTTSTPVAPVSSAPAPSYPAGGWGSSSPAAPPAYSSPTSSEPAPASYPTGGWGTTSVVSSYIWLVMCRNRRAESLLRIDAIHVSWQYLQWQSMITLYNRFLTEHVSTEHARTAILTIG